MISDMQDRSSVVASTERVTSCCCVDCASGPAFPALRTAGCGSDGTSGSIVKKGREGEDAVRLHERMA